MNAKPSSYLLVLENRKEQKKRVGCLGTVRFAAGFYVYVGSGGTNVVKRIRRHMASSKRLRWHIDYLTTGRNRMKSVDARVYPGVPECSLAARLARELVSISRFGASDCACPTHLFLAATRSALASAIARLSRCGVRGIALQALPG